MKRAQVWAGLGIVGLAGLGLVACEGMGTISAKGTIGPEGATIELDAKSKPKTYKLDPATEKCFCVEFLDEHGKVLGGNEHGPGIPHNGNLPEGTTNYRYTTYDCDKADTADNPCHPRSGRISKKTAPAGSTSGAGKTSFEPQNPLFETNPLGSYHFVGGNLWFDAGGKTLAYEVEIKAVDYEAALAQLLLMQQDMFQASSANCEIVQWIEARLVSDALGLPERVEVLCYDELPFASASAVLNDYQVAFPGQMAQVPLGEWQALSFDLPLTAAAGFEQWNLFEFRSKDVLSTEEHVFSATQMYSQL